MVIIMGREDDKLLKLKGTYAWVHNFSYLSHHDEGTMSSSLLWHSIFLHKNYDSLHMLKKNGFSSIPTIPRNFQQCEACFLGKHSKQPFHDSILRAHRKLEFINSNLCGCMTIPYTFGYIYIMNFIDDYTRICWGLFVETKVSNI